MNVKRTWVVAGATLAIAGFGTAVAVAADDGSAPGPREPRPASVVEQAPAQPGQPDSSPESADSPDASPVDSADSPADQDHSPDTADSPN